jgi:hypothetical protein
MYSSLVGRYSYASAGPALNSNENKTRPTIAAMGCQNRLRVSPLRKIDVFFGLSGTSITSFADAVFKLIIRKN